MQLMSTSATLTREILLGIATTVLQARRARRWTQRRLAAVCGMSQSMISEIERALVPDLPVATTVRILSALDVRIDLRLIAPTAGASPVRDRAHARCVAYVARRLEHSGWAVATEVAAGDARWRGFIDVLAFHPSDRVMLVNEVKVDFDDVGGVDRQLGAYESHAWGAAHELGWRPRAMIGALLLLATDANDRRLAEHRSYMDRRFRLRASALADFIADPSRPPDRGERGVAMIDPRTRRVRWIRPTWLDGRRNAARYADRAAFLAA
jgi:transcriptional regulator with XRE-family HTH domain